MYQHLPPESVYMTSLTIELPRGIQKVVAQESRRFIQHGLESTDINKLDQEYFSRTLTIAVTTP